VLHSKKCKSARVCIVQIRYRPFVVFVRIRSLLMTSSPWSADESLKQQIRTAEMTSHSAPITIVGSHYKSNT
jgi:hypothetical protein